MLQSVAHFPANLNLHIEAFTQDLEFSIQAFKDLDLDVLQAEDVAQAQLKERINSLVTFFRQQNQLLAQLKFLNQPLEIIPESLHPTA